RPVIKFNPSPQPESCITQSNLGSNRVCRSLTAATIAWGRQRKWCCGIAGCEGSRRKRLGGRLASRHRYLLPAGPPVLRRPVETTSNSGQTRAQLDCPLCAASSTGRCNTGVKSLCWGFKLQGLTRSFIELTRPLCSNRLASTPTSRFPSESTVSADRWCSHWNRAATDFADRRSKRRRYPCHIAKHSIFSV